MNNAKPKVSIVVLTWNALDKTKRFWDSFSKQTYKDRVDVIFVDNASSDGTQSFLEQQSSITLIKNSENLGYAKAVNIGIKAASPESDIILLNNDIEFLTPDSLETFMSSGELPDPVGLVGCKILRPDKTLQHCGAYLPIDTCWGQQLGSNEHDINQYAGVYPSESIVFACVYIKREVIENIGFLDEDFFAYFEDTDYCLRVHHAGYSVVVNSEVKILHHENSSTAANKVKHSDLFLKSQTTFKMKWLKTLQEERYKLGAVDLHSIINFPSGYASSARSITEALDRLGVRVAYKYIYGEGTPFPVDEPEYSDSYIVNMVKSRAFETAETQIAYSQGDAFYKNTGKYKIGFTMLEVTGIPREWVDQANMMDEVWVPSKFNVQTFRESGVKRPIKIVPLGIDPHYFHPDLQGFPISDTFTFLSIFEWGERKAPDILLKAFSDEFSTTEDVVLICKIGNGDASISVEQEIANLKLRRNGGRVRILLNRKLKQYEMGVLYRSSDCFVLPSRGEGWGMPYLEAMACGLPTIGTNWSSQTDFMHDGNSLLIEVEKLIDAEAKCPYYDGFEWAQPSYEHLRKLMRWTFENREAAAELGSKASKEARNSWSWDNTARSVIDHVTNR